MLRTTKTGAVDFLKGKITSRLIVFFAGALLGLVVFAFLFGLAVVNPENVGWIYNINGDVAQHYVGWVYFRESDWGLPLGVAKDLAYPYGVPVTFMDAIPLFALIFKLFAPILPETFQYLGMFTLISYMVQGGVAALIMYRFNKNLWIVLICSVFFVLSSILLMRSFAHTALTASWIPLLGIYFILESGTRQVGQRRVLLTWTPLLVVSVLIHPYFFPMVLALFLVYIVRTYQKEKLIALLIRVAVPPLVAIAVFGLIGGLSPKNSVLESRDLDIYSLNLVSPVDPLGYSSLISRKIFVDDRADSVETTEKISYLGLGLILLIPVVFYGLIMSMSDRKKKIKASFKKSITRKNIYTLAIVVGLLLFSLGSHIKLADHVLFTWNLPASLESIWLTFRSTARMFWPIYYGIIIFILVYILKRFTGKKTVLLGIFLLPFLLIQVVDIVKSSAVRGKRASISEYATSEIPSSPLSNLIVSKYCDKEHLISLSPYLYIEEFTMFSVPAIKCRLSMSEGYYAHDYKKAEVRSFIETEKDKLIRGTADTNDNLYLTTDVDFIPKINERYSYEKVSNWYIIK